MFSKKLHFVFSGILIVSCACLLSGCFKNKVLVKVKKDGSGNIVVTQMFSPKVVKTVEAQKKKNGGAGPGLVNKQQIEFMAKTFGDNVKFSKMKELDKPDGSKGYIAIYAFENINDVKIIPFMLLPGSNTDSITFNFESGKEGVSKLTVNLKKIEKQDASGEDKKEYPSHPLSAQDLGSITQMKAMGNPFNISEKDSKEDMLKKMFTDMTSSLEIETEGTLVKSNAAYPSKKKASRFTVADINFNDLMKSKKFLYELAGDMKSSPANIMQLMYSCPEGFTYDNQGKIVVEFK